jgi:penicillin-binding protein 1C
MSGIFFSFRYVARMSKSRLVLTVAALFLIILVIFGLNWLRTPRPKDVTKMALGSDRVLLASDGQVLQTLRTDFNKRRLAWHPLSNFPLSLQTAVTESEDRRFRSHWGIDYRGLGRAFWANLRGRRVQGASTITMQLSDLIRDDVLVKNKKIQKGSIPHKFVQMARALMIEAKWSKDEILEAYLNLIHLRGEFQGVPALSQAYLGRDPLALSNDEGVVIASMISSPNQSALALKQRACNLAKRMNEKSEHADSLCSTLDQAALPFFQTSPKLPTSTGIAPHVARRLFQAYPDESVVASTLDSGLQREVSAILEKNISRLAGSNVRDTAAIVIENETGRVVAYVGPVSTSKNPHVDGVQAYRQAGSSLKPFFYGKAIEMKRLTSASILLDEPTAISWGADVYRPTNYDKHFYGAVTAREALGSSLNVPAVKTVTIIGLHQAYQVLQSIHLTNLKEPDFYGVSMALGAVEVRLDELANAYRIFAQSGRWTPLSFVSPVKASRTSSGTPSQVYSPEAAFVVSQMLSDSNARAIGFGWESPLETPFWSAVKTGTSKDYRDNWCVGYSSKYTVAVWAGNFNAEAMDKVSGVSGVGPSWYEIMTKLHERTRSEEPKMPTGVVAKNVRHQWASREQREYFIAGTEPAGNVIEPALEKNAQFVFPAEGSVLVKDPHMNPENIALYVRFKGSVPAKSRLLLDGKVIGEAMSPFRLQQLSTGYHELSIDTTDREKSETLAKVRFRVKGA